ncbi:MAG: glucose-6-phosphate dehydrogenase [Thermoleophilia bacterium]
MIDTFIIFGASGDLTSRYLVPALARLEQRGDLGEGVVIRGVSREPWSDEDFRTHLRERLQEHAPDIPVRTRERLLARLEYSSGDVTDSERMREVLRLEGPAVLYLALPPTLFAPALLAIRDAGLTAGSRIVIEKPFGTDLESARRLNDLLDRSFPDCRVFRLDHFLGEQTVQNILGLRFANRIFEPLWNSDHIERVDIVWEETLALEDRAGYYDQTGALRDMIQNHLLQLMALLAMEPPATFSERDLRDRKAELLRAVRRLSRAEALTHTVRGRYTAGQVGGREVPAYAEEQGVNPDNQTETFAQTTLWVDNWRWAGTPFVLRTGKALGRDRKAVHIHFRRPPHLAFEKPACPPANVLLLTLQPDTVSLGVNINGAGDPFDLEQVDLRTDLAPQSVPAYGRLLLDVLEGDPSLSVRGDEAEEAWRIVEPILDAWKSGEPPLLPYAAGSEGPEPLAEPIC